MTEKIEWYKEVLALEPGSKIFFPLARMLEREGDLEQACEVLKEGVRRHGEYLEARLLLVQLLERLGRDAECAAEVEVLAGLLARYEGFWSAWSASAGTAGSDPALFVRMLGLSLRRPDLTVAELLRRGLDSFAEGQGRAREAKPAAVQPDAAQPEAARPESVQAESVQSGGARPAPVQPQAEGLSGDVAPGEPLQEAPAPEGASAPAAQAEAGKSASAAAAPGAARTAAKSAGAPAKARPAGVSLRTRSMAEVLAEQGDLASAAEIYGELALAAPEGEREALERRRDEIRAMQASQAQASGKQPERPGAGARPASKLVTLLENLAARVEARANS